MTVIVTDNGFAADDWIGEIVAADMLSANENAELTAVNLEPDSDLAPLEHRLADIDMIRIAFPSFADGRGFTLARRLRRLGYTGRLRASGHVIADQYAMARRSGFDEVEIDDDLAERQPEDHWRARANWRAHDYQSRLRA